jgi:hypothetical protein
MMMQDQKPRDAIDTRVRILCGALLGILLGACGGILFFGPSNEALFATIALALTFAFLALRF